MSWNEVDQSRTDRGAVRAPVTVCLSVMRRGGVRLWVTLSEETRLALGWSLGDTLAMDAGSGPNQGRFRLRRAPGGRILRTLPNSTYCAVAMMPPDYCAGWEVARTAAEHEVQADGTLVVTLPWEFPPQAPAEEAELA